MTDLQKKFEGMFRVAMSDSEINSISAMLESADAPVFIKFVDKLCEHNKALSFRKTLDGDTRSALNYAVKVQAFEEILKLNEGISQCFCPR